MGEAANKLRFPGDECPPNCVYSMRLNAKTEGISHRHCGYILKTGRSRGCEPGKGCKRYENRKQPPNQPMTVKNPRQLSWDVKRGRELWQQGRTLAAIAEELGISRASVARRVAEYWKKGAD